MKFRRIYVDFFSRKNDLSSDDEMRFSEFELIRNSSKRRKSRSKDHDSDTSRKYQFSQIRHTVSSARLFDDLSLINIVQSEFFVLFFESRAKKSRFSQSSFLSSESFKFSSRSFEFTYSSNRESSIKRRSRDDNEDDYFWSDMQRRVTYNFRAKHETVMRKVMPYLQATIISKNANERCESWANSQQKAQLNKFMLRL